MKKFLRLSAVAVAVAATLAGAAYAGQVITGSVAFSATFFEAVTSGIESNQLQQATGNLGVTYGSGTASRQVDTLYAANLTLAGAPATLDLTALMDPANNAVSFARVREFIVVNTSSTAGNDVKVVAAATKGVTWLPPAANPLNARYLGSLRVSDPVSTGTGNGNVVVSGANTSVTLDPGANTATVTVLIVGGSGAFVVVLFPFGLARARRRRPAA